MEDIVFYGMVIEELDEVLGLDVYFSFEDIVEFEKIRMLLELVLMAS